METTPQNNGEKSKPRLIGRCSFLNLKVGWQEILPATQNNPQNNPVAISILKTYGPTYISVTTEMITLYVRGYKVTAMPSPHMVDYLNRFNEKHFSIGPATFKERCTIESKI